MLKLFACVSFNSDVLPFVFYLINALFFWSFTLIESIATFQNISYWFFCLFYGSSICLVILFLRVCWLCKWSVDFHQFCLLGLLWLFFILNLCSYLVQLQISLSDIYLSYLYCLLEVIMIRSIFCLNFSLILLFGYF